MSRSSGKTEVIALQYCYEEGFKAGYLIGKYGLDFIMKVNNGDDAELVTKLNKEADAAARDFWDSA